MKRLFFLIFALPLAIALALPSSAQNRNDRPTINQLVAHDEARIAQLKAILRISEEQERDWQRFEAALKGISRKRAERRIALIDEWEKREADKEKKPLTHAEALRKHADALLTRAEEIRVIADAAEPFSEKLNNWQRQQVDQIIRAYVQAPLIPEDSRRRNY
jgi:quinol monooxygenase YgiN